jgi:hypothetical protein
MWRSSGLFCFIASLPFHPVLAEDKASVQLIVVDRSMSKDLLYVCNIHIPKDVPVQAAALIMYDRKRNKVAEVPLAIYPTLRGERGTSFFLNHEMVKFSVVEVHIYPPDDDRHERIRFIVGERPAYRKEGEERVEVKID